MKSLRSSIGVRVVVALPWRNWSHWRRQSPKEWPQPKARTARRSSRYWRYDLPHGGVRILLEQMSYASCCPLVTSRSKTRRTEFVGGWSNHGRPATALRKKGSNAYDETTNCSRTIGLDVGHERGQGRCRATRRLFLDQSRRQALRWEEGWGRLCFLQRHKRQLRCAALYHRWGGDSVCLRSHRCIDSFHGLQRRDGSLFCRARLPADGRCYLGLAGRSPSSQELVKPSSPRSLVGFGGDAKDSSVDFAGIAVDFWVEKDTCDVQSPHDRQSFRGNQFLGGDSGRLQFECRVHVGCKLRSRLGRREEESVRHTAPHVAAVLSQIPDHIGKNRKYLR